MRARDLGRGFAGIRDGQFRGELCDQAVTLMIVGGLRAGMVRLRKEGPLSLAFVASLRDAGPLCGLFPGVTSSLRSASTPGYFRSVPTGLGLCGREIGFVRPGTGFVRQGNRACAGENSGIIFCKF